MLYYTVSFHSYILSNILIRSAEDSTMSFNSTGRINALVVTIDHSWFLSEHFQMTADSKILTSISCICYLSYSEVSTVCQGLEENPNGHPQVRGNYWGCLRTRQNPSKLKIFPQVHFEVKLYELIYRQQWSLWSPAVYSDKQTWDIFCLKDKWWCKSMYDRFILTTFNELINRALYSLSVVNV